MTSLCENLMKNKLFLTMTLICSLGTFANSLQGTTLIIPKVYSANSGLLKTVTSSFLVDTVGEFTNVEKEIQKKLSPYSVVLMKYYSSAEQKTLVNEISNVINKRIIRGNMTDSRAMAMGQYIGQELIGKIFNRVLEVEGIKDPVRRSEWGNKLLAPFNECMNKASNYLYDASGCIESLTTSLVPNVGLALTHEMAKDKLSGVLPFDQRENFINSRTNAYKLCFYKSKKDADSVKNCALESIKEGVVTVTEKKVDDTIAEATNDPFLKRKILDKSMAPFKRCIRYVGRELTNMPYDKQINRCIDSLVSNVGQELVPLKITQNKSVTNALSDKELKVMLPQKQKEFKQCIAQMVSLDQRVGGIIDSKQCEVRITNDITRTVVLKIFDTNAQKNLATINKSLANNVVQNAQKKLDACWSSEIAGEKKSTCLKDSISTLSLDIANEKIKKELPKENPETLKIRKDLTGEFGKCLNSNLTGDVASDSKLTDKIADCTGELTRNSAMKIAQYQLSEIMGDKFNGTEKAHIINKHVYLDLDKCLGKSPDEKTLAKCIEGLKKNASIDVAGLSFSEEIDKFIKNGGGKDRLGIKTSDVQKLKIKLKKDLNECIELVKATDPMPEINQCIKGRIKELALTLGGYQFNSSASPLYSGREDVLEGFYTTFNNDFSTCLSKAEGIENDLNSYMNNLTGCTNDISSQTMENMGRDQIDFALKQNLKDRPGVSREKQRQELSINLLAPFKECLVKEVKKENCINNLKTDATQKVVEQYAHNEVEFQLNTKEIPPSLLNILNEFQKCMSRTEKGDNKAQDNCVKNFAIKFASGLGELKVKSILTSTLGSADYHLNEKQIDEVLKDYNKCLRNLSVKERVNEVTGGVTACIASLQEAAENIVKKTASSWISTTSPFEEINATIASSLPCFAGLIPASPYSGGLKGNVDSALKPVAIIIGQYLDYNITEAKNDLPVVLEKLLKDLDEGESLAARSNLVDTLVETGALDQLIKAIVLDKVKTGLKDIPDSELPKEVKDKISKKENLNSIFEGDTAKAIRELVASTILRPVLIDGEKMTGEKVSLATKSVTSKVTEALATSDKFGKEIIQASVQNKINQMGSVKSFFGKLIYGKDAFQWSNVRSTSKGVIAEAYITKSILLPKLRGEEISPQELEKINKRAEELVTEAVKNYD